MRAIALRAIALRAIALRAIGLIALVAIGCTPAAPAAPAVPVATVEQRAEKQILRVGITSYPSNPTPAGGTIYPQYYGPLYDTLTWFKPGYVVDAAVAEKWSVTADGLSWTFNLRKDVTWPDGTTLTADDVAFTMKTINDLNWPQKAVFAAVKEVRATDAATVVFTMNVADMALPNNATGFRIIQKAYWDRVGGFDGFLAKPQGSGPYELVEYRAGDITRYVKRPGKHAFRVTPLDEVVFKVVPEATQQINGLRLGELDLVVGAFSADQLDQMKNAGLTLDIQESTSSHINFPFSTYDRSNTPLKDIRVRQALNYAIDKESIAKAVYKGFNRPVGQMGTPGSAWWDDSAQPIPFNQARAKELLAAAGYAAGFKVTYDQQAGQVPNELILAVQGNLRDVGVDMSIVPNDQASFLDKYFGRAAKGDLFPLISGDTNGFFQSLRNAYTCVTGAGAPGLGLYCNPELDKLLVQAFAEPDSTKRAAIMKQANKLMRADWPQIWLLTVNQGVVYQPKVKNVQLATVAASNFDSIYIAK